MRPIEANPPVRETDRLLEESWTRRSRRLPRREVLTEVLITAVFLLLALALSQLSPPVPSDLWLTIGLATAYAIASRVEISLGAGFAVPTQLFLIPMLLLGPPANAPLIVFVGLLVAGIADWFAQRAKLERVLFAGGDAIYALGPALIFVLAGSPGPADAAWWLLIAALLTQMTSEIITVTVRERLVFGVKPKLQFKVLSISWAIDVLLTPAGLVGAAVSTGTAVKLGPFAALGMTTVLGLLTLDRNRRIASAHERLEALRRERRRLQLAVERIGDAFASKLDLDALLTITMSASVEALDADSGRASATSGPGRKLARRAAVNEDPLLDAALAAAESEALEVRALGSVLIKDVWAIAYALQRSGSLNAAGVVAVARRGTPFDPEELLLFQHLCEQASVAAENVEHHELLHRQAHTDHLTGLANPRRMQELLAQGADRHALAGCRLALVLLDLDDFKAINDFRGHQTGDQVLRTVAESLQQHFRVTDEPARYGGEELAVVIQDTPYEEVLRLAERARAAIEALELVDADGLPFRVTASVGVAEFGLDIHDVSQLMAAADAALYQAKSDGKNVVRAAPVRSADFHRFLTGQN